MLTFVLVLQWETSFCTPLNQRASSVSFLFIHMPLHHKPVQRASGSSWACGHNTERQPHQSSLHPAHGEERRATRGEEDNLGEILFHTHATNLSLLVEKLQRTSVVLRGASINLHVLSASLTDALSLSSHAHRPASVRSFELSSLLSVNLVLVLHHFYTVTTMTATPELNLSSVLGNP